MSGWLLALLVATPPSCPTSTLRLDWVRSATAVECPSGEVVARRIVDRLGCDPFGPEPKARFEVAVEGDAPGWRAKLTRFEDDGVVSEKTLVSEDDDCAILGQAVALTIAVVAERLPRIGLIETGTTAPPEAPLRARVPLVPTSTATPVVYVPPQGTFDVEAVLNVGTLPDVSFGGRLTTSLRVGRRFELGVGALVLPIRTVDAFFFGVIAAVLHGCSRFEPGGRFELAGCVRVYGGSMLGFTKVEAVPIDPGGYPWFAASAGASFTAPITGPVHFRLGTEALVTLVDRKFAEKRTMTIVLNESPVAFVGTAGLILRFR
ncbi:MAG: hypothetical protein RMA76_26395 [Deltaproteobacteria bacterium]|jgi:hypothetical protein